MQIVNASLRLLRYASLLLLPFLPLKQLTAQGLPPRAHLLVSAAGYEQLLDLLFPREYPKSLKLEYVMVLRFEPNAATESQLVLRAWHDGHTEATLYTLQGGSAWRTANAYIARTNKEDIQAIASSIKVISQSLSISKNDLDAWHSSMYKTLRASELEIERAAAEYQKDGTREVVLDGAKYNFWYLQGEIELHWCVSDVDLKPTGENGNSPLARWMNKMRLALGPK